MGYITSEGHLPRSLVFVGGILQVDLPYKGPRERQDRS